MGENERGSCTSLRLRPVDRMRSLIHGTAFEFHLLLALPSLSPCALYLYGGAVDSLGPELCEPNLPKPL